MRALEPANAMSLFLDSEWNLDKSKNIVTTVQSGIILFFLSPNESKFLNR